MTTNLLRVICPLGSPTTSATSRTTSATSRTFFLRLAQFSVSGRSEHGRKPGVTGALDNQDPRSSNVLHNTSIAAAIQRRLTVVITIPRSHLIFPIGGRILE